MEIILKNNRNIMYNILTCLEFKERYNLCITNKDYLKNKFQEYKHQELINIKCKDYLLSYKWSNIKFKIILRNAKIKDVSILRNIHTLDLSKCKNIKDVSMLGNVHTLNLSECENISILGNSKTIWNCNTLDLSNCNNIKDVSMFKNVNTLDLSWCNKITNVSMLGNVDTLDLSWCDKIKDISMLYNVRVLYLSHCTNITNITNNKSKDLNNKFSNEIKWRCQKLDLSYTNITDISMLGNISILDLSYCDNITDISMLGNGHALYLSNCKNIVKWCNKEKWDYHIVDLSYTNITDTSMLENIHILNLSNCKNIIDVSILKNVNDLDLSSTNIENVVMLKNVNSLILNNCENIPQGQINYLRKNIKNFMY